ncbi:phosphatidylinositol glycan anchor biosynthesis class L [Oratosquilla oratoria]|uniref:phosphatidylinositol glycan anchor biosynthesis class L n=1 Tax=Oratosquilla oratoria TaxID=337810 RepID=UPI003F77627F
MPAMYFGLTCEPMLALLGIAAGFGFTLSYFTLGNSKRASIKRQKGAKLKDSGGVCRNGCGNSGEIGCSSGGKQRILIIIAHPDDECMFFGPTILHFTRDSNSEVYLLCLSKGNYRGEGAVRTKELWESCKVLGVAQQNVILYNSDALPDNPHVMWPTTRTANIISHHANSLDIDMIITFDRRGVSGHINHCSVYSAVKYLVEMGTLPPGCIAYSLDSVSVLRKYSSVMDLSLSFILSSCVFTVDFQNCLILKAAMRCYQSQYVWYRKLYMIFSRYIFINTLSEIKA